MHSGVLYDAMVDLTRRHAQMLLAEGPIMSLHRDPCPRCMGRVIASDTSARCAAGCGWSYRETASHEPVASRRVEQ